MFPKWQKFSQIKIQLKVSRAFKKDNFTREQSFSLSNWGRFEIVRRFSSSEKKPNLSAIREEVKSKENNTSKQTSLSFDLKCRRAYDGE